MEDLNRALGPSAALLPQARRRSEERSGRRQRGSSVVELALVAPLLIALILWACYLFELSAARIKQQEITRFLGWELTSYALSDLGEGNHAFQYERASEAAIAETRHRYAGLSGHGYRSRQRGLVSAASLTEEGLSLEAEGLHASSRIELPGGSVFGSFHRVVEPVGRSQEKVLERYRLNVDHVGATAKVQLRLENRLMPRSLGGASFFPERLDRLELRPSTTLLLGDTWYLPDGRDVGLPGGSAGKGGLFWKQVDRIALLGLGSELSSRAGDAAKVLDWFPIRPEAQLVSQRYGALAGDRSPFKGCSTNELAQSGKWRNGDPGTGTPKDRLSKVKCFDTLPIDADKLGRGYHGDPSFRILESRGDAYMGCLEPGARDRAACSR